MLWLTKSKFNKHIIQQVLHFPKWEEKTNKNLMERKEKVYYCAVGWKSQSFRKKSDYEFSHLLLQT